MPTLRDGPGGEHRGGREPEEGERKRLLAQRSLRRGARVLQRRRRQATKTIGRTANCTRASVVRPARTTNRSCARRDGSARARIGRVDGGEHQRVGERFGGDERGVEEVGHEQREGGERERDRASSRPSRPSDQEHGHGGEGHRQRADRLDDAERGVDVADQPRRRGDDRLEQRREVRGAAADQRPPGLGDRPADRRVDVLVGEQRRHRPQPCQGRPDGEAHHDEAGERVDDAALHTGLARHDGAAPLGKREGAVSRALSITRRFCFAYGQAPCAICADGPFLEACLVLSFGDVAWTQ